MRKISSLLVANRGEIAVRIIRACRELGIKTILAASEADRESLPAQIADRVVCLGPPRAAESYLKVGAVVMAAVGTGAEAIHPGYGFLAENPELPEACRRYGLIFVGPKAEQIRRMGDKISARRLAADLEIPVIPGSGRVEDPGEIFSLAERIGYPLLLKAAGGGGGKGMKIVREPGDLAALFPEAREEARAAFGDGRLYLEKFIPRARHVEFQIMGDRQGNVVHLGERDCSLQRRYQKMVEEAPSPAASPALRTRMSAAAVKIGRAIQYESAGTVEFILDQDSGEFYFLEMNTRIQVEHPVTEMTTGIDLVKEQIRVAAGFPLSFSQGEVRPSGHALECRINAEDPREGFRPCPGRIQEWHLQPAPGIRVDTHGYAGYRVPPYYDSLLAKVVASGGDRREAMERMQSALERFLVSGLETTIPFYRSLMRNRDFQEGRVHTRWVEETFLKEYADHERNPLHR
jgi:acetyl-CoA carboxylase biotin carboxylase subunit